MRKTYVILIYVICLLLGSIGVTFIVWKDIKGETISEEYYKNYNLYKEKLLNYENYSTTIEDLDIEVDVYQSNDSSYLVSTTFSNPLRNYSNLIILVIDESELENKTNKVYPSLGIVGDFNNEFVTNSPNKKTTHSQLTMNYENDKSSEGVLIYLEYYDNNKTSTFYLNVSVN